MPEDIQLQVFPATFPPGYCPRNNQQLANDIAAGMRVVLPGEISLGIISSAEPIVEYRDRVWFKVDSATNVLLGVFTWSTLYGLWVKPHWNNNQPPTKGVSMFKGTLTELETYDGGEPGTISDTTGPFWVEDTDFGDKFPLGVGATITTPNTAANVFDDATPGAPQGRSVYFIKPSGRLMDRGN
jgi:hypothetical protein